MGGQSDILDVPQDPRWLNNVILFSTEIWAEQLQKTTLYIILHHKRAFGPPFAIGPRDHGRLA